MTSKSETNRKAIQTNDIVARLNMQDNDENWESLMLEAADEIKRLRAELAMAQKWRDNFKSAFEKERKSTEYWYGQAVNHE